MNTVFSIMRKNDRDFLVDIVGTIYLYTNDHKLHFVKSVKDVAECFLNPEKRINNDMVKNHESFVANLFVKAAKYLLKSGLHNNMATYREIGQALNATPEENLNFMAAIIHTLLTANEAEKQEIFTFMEEQNKYFRKIMNNKNEV